MAACKKSMTRLFLYKALTRKRSIATAVWKNTMKMGAWNIIIRFLLLR